MNLQLNEPRPLGPNDTLELFECSEASLDDWLKRRALANQISGASRTFVVTDPGDRVYGYYALAAGAVSHAMATRGVRQNMPEPIPVTIPVMVLARLAVDRHAQGIKLGAAMLQDAVRRAVHVSQNAGVRALLVHALNDRATTFYENYGFRRSPHHDMTLMLRLPPPHELGMSRSTRSLALSINSAAWDALNN